MLQSFAKKVPLARRSHMSEAHAHVLMAMGALMRAKDSTDEIMLLHTVDEMIAERLELHDPRYSEWVTKDLVADNLRALVHDPDCSPELAHSALELARAIS